MLKKVIFPLLLFFVILLISIINYAPDTYLSGWDNLHPEFNFSLNIKRSIFAVWQEYQGLGLMGGMGHASDLPRQVFLWILSLILPVNTLRYFYHGLMLFFGSLGVYFLLKDRILSRYQSRELVSFTGAIFYLFNLGTLQMFYLPFEPYSAHFASLPWLFWATIGFIRKENKRALFFLILANILAVPQGYVITFFFVSMIALTIFLVHYFFQERHSIKKILIIYLVIFSVNAFWLLPNLYFVFTRVNVNVEAKINQMSTETNFLQNKKYGDLADTALLKGFWFDLTQADENGKIKPLMGNWKAYLSNWPVSVIGYLLFLVSLIGMFFAIKDKQKDIKLFLPIFILSFIVLSNDTPVVSLFNSLFYKFPFFSQIFRFPFTKFAILVAFCLSIFYSFTCMKFLQLIRSGFLKSAVVLVFSLVPIIFVFPVFRGDLFSKENRASIPQEYFQVFDFFKKQDDSTRIANFPQPGFWGWTFYRWGYSGSGFLWYGTPQPILDRAFDVWSKENENYYWEISYALYSQDKQLFEKVLEKYQINWLLVDGNVINPPSSKALFTDELTQMLNSSDKVSFEKNFGKIKIYRIKLEAPVKNFVFLAGNLPLVGPKYNWNNNDRAYLENGNYTTSTSANQQSIYYPFRSLFTDRQQEEHEFTLKEQDDSLIFEKVLPDGFKDYDLLTPDFNQQELVWIDPGNLKNIKFYRPEIHLEGNLLTVKVPKVNGYFSAQIDPTKTVLPIKYGKSCNQISDGWAENKVIHRDGKDWLRLSSKDTSNCGTGFWLENLDHERSYIIAVESQNVKGRPLLFWLENQNLRRADIETYLPKTHSNPFSLFMGKRNPQENISYFIQPPMDQYGLGYSLHLDNISIGRQETINDLGQIRVYQLPYEFLTQIKFVPKNISQLKFTYWSNVNTLHPNPSFYEVALQPAFSISKPTLILSQSFSTGWQAYYMDNRLKILNNKFGGLLAPLLGKRVDNHLLVNNWENGWLIDNNNQAKIINIVFVPQYLEYLGFLLALVIIPVLLLTIPSKKLS